MPELPEVETIVRGLREAITGATVEKLQVIDPRISLPEKEIIGKRIAAIERRGKYIVFKLAPSGALIFHLRMSGRLLRVCAEGEGRYSRLVLHLDSGVLRFVNPRRLGTVEYSANGFPHELGVEPLSDAFTVHQLRRLLAGSRRPVKPFLMDQRKIAGLGNIYASEALWRAEIDPRRAANTITAKEARALHRGIVSVLQEAIEHMGTTFSDYRDSDGNKGGFQDYLGVYGKEGRKCSRCGTEIIRVNQGGRSTYLCPGCQK